MFIFYLAGIIMFGGEETTEPRLLKSVIINAPGLFTLAWPELSIERKDAAALVIPCTPVGLLSPLDEKMLSCLSVAVCGGFSGTEVLQDCVLYRDLEGL